METIPVPGLAVRNVLFILAHARKRGINDALLFQGWPHGEAALRDILGVMEWATCLQLMERLNVAAGGAWAMEEMFRSIVGESDGTLMGSARITPAQFYSGLMPQAMRNIVTGMHVEYDTLPGGTVRTVVSIPDRYPASLPFMSAWVGLHRGASAVFGLAPAVVEGEFSGRRGVFLLTMPTPPRTARRSRTLRGAMRFSPFLAADGPDVSAPVPIPGDPAHEQTLAETARRLGERLLACTTLSQVADQLREMLLSQGFHGSLWLWAVPPTGDALELVQEGTLLDVQPRYLCPLTLDSVEVGRLMLNLPPFGAGPGRRWFAALLPWITLAVDKCRASAEEQRAPNAFPQHAEDLWRLEAAVATWQLTPRQAEVLQLLVRGCSNKEIGARLGTSIKTVELHVTQLLRKTTTDNRAALIARFWSSALDGSAGPAERLAVAAPVRSVP